MKITLLREAMNGPNFYILLLAGVLVNGRELGWENRYDQPLHFNCPSRKSISHINSQHVNYYEDRVWDFECKDTFVSEPECHWSPYVNDFDQEFSFKCPNNYVLTGVNSYHSNYHEDRRWKFYCCRVNSYCNQNCQWTSYVNYFDEVISWQVPGLNYLVGAGSYHSNYYEDRRWRYQYCTRKSNC
ncbi:hemagglutinin/amebocyte aggregation factor-like isoform X2 [Salvelinus fontinalis]|uniref:hemagglutinin/amebocyte aggregation factor-like isoform X2 n=1 Tax=Salvelinus fontinalis TaxID=8038 RepID=UPI002486293F|nr:hemagglutinin/amebocyte aggregation factor-like isoform X2 [Salvelinus fontinalis]